MLSIMGVKLRNTTATVNGRGLIRSSYPATELNKLMYFIPDMLLRYSNKFNDIEVTTGTDFSYDLEFQSIPCKGPEILYAIFFTHNYSFI
jgi:hypothetical protein